MLETVPQVIEEIKKVYLIFKNGECKHIANYRPVYILCNFSNILETIAYGRFYRSLSASTTLEQYGFISNRSNVTNLECFTQLVSNVLIEQRHADVAYTDFSIEWIMLSRLEWFGFRVQGFLLFNLT